MMCPPVKRWCDTQVMARGRRSDRWTSRPVAPVLGVDIGGVIVSSALSGEDTSFFGDRPMLTPPVQGSIEAISALAAGPFEDRVHLISKAGPKIAGITLQWLTEFGFLTRTRLDLARVHFVRDRAEKDGVASAIGVTHFVDDRMSVLNRMPSVPHLYLFTGGTREERIPRTGDVPAGITTVHDWSTLHRILTESTTRR